MRECRASSFDARRWRGNSLVVTVVTLLLRFKEQTMRPCWLTTPLLACLWLASPSCSDAWAQEAAEAWPSAAIHTLATIPDADTQVTAAALAHGAPLDAVGVLRLLDNAMALAPAARDMAQFDVTICSTQSSCDVRVHEARQQRLDPDNGAAWMADLHDATAQGDESRIDRTLNRMARTNRFDLYVSPLARRFDAALRRLAGMTEADRHVQVMGMVANRVLPPLQDIAHACHPDTKHGQRGVSCHSIARAMENGDSLIVNLVGLRIHEWNAHNEADRKMATTRYRQLRWQMSRLASIASTPRLPLAPQIESMLTHDREIDSINALLTAAGESLEPPAGWTWAKH